LYIKYASDSWQELNSFGIAVAVANVGILASCLTSTIKEDEDEPLPLLLLLLGETVDSAAEELLRERLVRSGSDACW
jgi:hypothetical protein